MEYNVRIREVRQAIVTVEADDMTEAKYIAKKNWDNGEYVHNIAGTRFHRATFEVLYPNHSLSEKYWDEGCR